MSHADEGRLHAFLDGELTPDEERQLGDHLGDCIECAARFEEVAEVHARAGELLAVAGGVGAAPEFAELEARAAGGRTSAPPTPSLLMPGLAWAATLVLAFFLGWQASDRAQPTVAGRLESADRATRLAEAPAPSTPAAVGESATPSLVAAPHEAAREDDSEAPPATVQEATPDTEGGTHPAAAGEREKALENRQDAVAAAPAAAERVVAAPPPGEPQPAAVQMRAESVGRSRAAAGESEEEVLPREQSVILMPSTRMAQADQVAVAAEPFAGARSGEPLRFTQPLSPDGLLLLRRSDVEPWLGQPPLLLPEGTEAMLQELALAPATRADDDTVAAVVRARYGLPGGDILTLWQHAGAADAEADPAAAFLAAPVTTAAAGPIVVEWSDPRGYRLRAESSLPYERLRELVLQLRPAPPARD